ncbi:13895_t:CDS:10 [Ambispora leptoticha]|uniref:13895_t:CDS:1 n=1 Tax=Ambispora leptoticha TaxID=144679 RepID=A0A9N8YVJ8_9GLOM|nr:13895_t:CDS:10 [Ambispora leptoticha]
MRVLVTGASGLLGRAVYKTFLEDMNDVIGLAKTRAKGDLRQLDLTDTETAEIFINEIKPNVIVHCAAERRPDVAEKNRDATLHLNVEVSGQLATIAAKSNSLFIYLSTDYVFDGTNPPYGVDATPNPLNFYGETKYKGEVAVLNANPNAVILRVTVLYGDVEYPGESAVNILLETVKNTQKTVEMDHYARRYPTCVEDIARVIKDLAKKQVEENIPIKGIFHFSAQEAYTKYQMCVVFAEILHLPIDHITPNDKEPASTEVKRPYDCRLSNDRLNELGIDTNYMDFNSWWTRKLIRRK